MYAVDKLIGCDICAVLLEHDLKTDVVHFSAHKLIVIIRIVIFDYRKILYLGRKCLHYVKVILPRA